MTESQLLRYILKGYSHPHNLIFADTETESLNLKFARPWDIGWVTETPAKKVTSYQYFPYFNDLKMSYGAQKVNNFDIYKYKQVGSDIKHACEELDNVLFDENNLIIGQYWLGFDCMIVNNFRILCGKKSDYSYLKRVIDTKALCMAYHLKENPNCAVGTNDFLAWQFRLLQKPKDRKLKTSLDFMIKEFGIDVAGLNRHESTSDNYLTREAFHKLLWKIDLYI